MPVVGLPAAAPERPASTPAFPAVHDIPPPRTNTTLTELEQQRMEDELVNVRDQQQGVVKPVAKKRTGPTVIRASSKQTIY